jgi:glycosyltransferase involved in cell wall biosynthesis
LEQIELGATLSKHSLVVIEQESQIGGVEMSTLVLVAGIDRQQYAPTVIAPEPGPLTTACAATGVPTHIAPRPHFRSASFRLKGHTIADPLAMGVNPWRLRQAAIPVTRILKEIEADLVVTKGLLAHFYGGRAARAANIPCIWHVQDEVPADRARGGYLKVLQMAARHYATTVIGDADSITAQFDAHPQRFTVYNGIDTAVFSPQTQPGTLRSDLGIPPQATLIGNLARLTDWKGQHVLIEAFASIAANDSDHHLVLIGSALFDNDQYEQRLHDIAAASSVADRIHFAGYRTDTSAALAALDVYVHCSLRKDTAPLALLSALATGLPTIISDVPGMTEVVANGETGLVVPTGDHAALAQTLQRLLANPDLCARLSAAARISAETRFSTQRYVSAMTDIFDMTLSIKTAT